MSVEQKTAIEEAQDECYDIWPRLEPNKARFYAMSLEEQWAETFASLEGREPWAVRLAKVEDTGNAGLPGYPGLNQRVLDMNSRAGILQSCLALYGSVMAAEDRAGLQADYDELMEPLSRGLAEFRAYEESSRHEIEESMRRRMSLKDRKFVVVEYLSSYSAALPPAVRYAMRQELLDIEKIQADECYDDPSDSNSLDLGDLLAFEDSLRCRIQESAGCAMLPQDRFHIWNYHNVACLQSLPRAEVDSTRPEKAELKEVVTNERVRTSTDPAAAAGPGSSSDAAAAPLTANEILGQRLIAQQKRKREFLDRTREALEDPHGLVGEQRLAWYNS